MFKEIRFQTGELNEIVSEMRKGNIPCMDVDDYDEFTWFVNRLKEHDIYHLDAVPLDRKARDTVKEPEFEFRATFSNSPSSTDNVMYIDFYFEPFVEREYDTIYGD